MACDGFANTRIATEVGVAAMTVKAWRDRFCDDGLKDFSSVRAGWAWSQVLDPGGQGRGDRPVDVARDAARGDALELSNDGGSVRRVAGDGPADLVSPRASAASG
jgi:hypothetical protein